MLKYRVTTLFLILAADFKVGLAQVLYSPEYAVNIVPDYISYKF